VHSAIAAVRLRWRLGLRVVEASGRVSARLLDLAVAGATGIADILDTGTGIARSASVARRLLSLYHATIIVLVGLSISVKAVVATTGTRFTAAANSAIFEVEAAHSIPKAAGGRGVDRVTSAASGRRHVTRVCDSLLLVKLLLFGPAPLPAVAPVSNKVVEQPPLQVEAWSDADGKVVEVHAVAFLVRQEEAEVARDGKEQVVVERRELRKRITELLRCGLSHHVEAGIVPLEISCQCVLQFLWEDLGWELAKPCFEHAANGVWVIELLFG